MARLLAATGVALALAAGWKTGAPLPEPRTEVAAAAAGGELVVVGGFLPDGSNSGRTDAYSPRLDRWRRLPDLPITVDHAAAASTGRRVYVAGGYGSNRQPVRDVHVLERGRWRELTPLPQPRAAAAAAIAGGKLYVVGGVQPDVLAGGRLARRAYVLDLETGRWSEIAGPTPREHLAAAAAQGRVYALGGRITGLNDNQSRFETYDPAARRWRRLAPIPEARGGTGAATLGGRIYSVGGEAPGGTIRAVYAYDLSTRRWRRATDLPTPRHGLGVVALNDRVYVVGGGPQPGLTVSGENESFKP